MRSSDDGPTAKAKYPVGRLPTILLSQFLVSAETVGVPLIHRSRSEAPCDATILSRTSAYMPEQRNTYRNTRVTFVVKK